MSFTIFLSLAALIALAHAQSYQVVLDMGLKSIPDDAKLTPQELCAKYNYPFETHDVVTQDGYILTLFRIKHGKAGTGNANTKVVFLQHCLLCTAAGFLSAGPDAAPAFRLAEAGYDVWMGNSRGSYFSRAHSTLSPDSKEFWDFTWTDMGQYDVPANIRFVKNFTGAQKISYVGHSQGTIQMFYALSIMEDELAESLNCYAALTPVAKVHHMTSPIFLALAYTHAATLVSGIGINEFLPRWWLLSDTAEWACTTLPFLCDVIFKAIADEKPIEDDMERAAVFLNYAPAGTSTKNMLHWQQLSLTDKFQLFDYGAKENEKRYGQKTPPEIDLTTLSKVPIGLFAGKDDELADPTDVAWLKTQIQKVMKADKSYDLGHISFLFGKDLSYVDDLIGFLNTYEAIEATVE